MQRPGVDRVSRAVRPCIDGVCLAIQMPDRVERVRLHIESDPVIQLVVERLFRMCGWGGRD
ncbi:MAG: hypothetical protein ACOYEP_12705 [Limnochordia bacterium]|jgi:hypothetical protein